MQTYTIPLVPGPTAVAPEVLQAYQVDYASGDLEPEYAGLYSQVQENLRLILKTRNQIAVITGEAMVGLWGALKSCLRPGDKVLAVSTGIFGDGIGQMAEGLGAEVAYAGFSYDEAADPNKVEDILRSFQPKMLTLVHCETPCGTLNPAREIGELVRRYGVPLYYVDAVSSAGGAPLDIDGWGIDLGMVGTQKCLSAVPDLGIVTISPKAWEIIGQVGYAGYDALEPWQTALQDHYFPSTPTWQGTAALEVATRRILDEGMEKVVQRHAEVAAYWRQRLAGMGLEIYPASAAASSPTVTAVKVPAQIDWPTLNGRLRQRGMGVGGSWGDLSGKVFRIGHMGIQANMELVQRGMDVLEAAVAR